MIDKVIKLQNGLEYYVIDEFVKGKRIYLFAIKVDNKNNITTDKCIVCEAKQVNNKLVINSVEDNAEEINDIFISRMHNEQKN